MERMNTDLPYEQQMMPILKRYDSLVKENKELKSTVEHLTNRLENAEKKAKNNLIRKNKDLDKETKDLKHAYEKKGEKMEWIQKELEEYLLSLGVELPEHRTITAIVKMIVKI